jgi:H+/Cl- antiporter ClcA
VAPVVLAAVGVAAVLVVLEVLLAPDVLLVVLLVVLVARQTSDNTVRAGRSSTSCRWISTSLNASYMNSS